MLNKPFLTAAMCAAVSYSALADGRIHTEVYSPNEIYTIHSKVGRVSLVQLEDGETLSKEAATLGMGDAAAWQVRVKGNNIVFKPKAAFPDTNMIVVSDKGRTYSFNLVTDSKQKTTYVLRFRYPDTERRVRQKQQEKQAVAMNALSAAGGINVFASNYNYWGRGSRALAPTSAYDNGRFTYLTFNNGRALPAFYRVEADGTETLLNTHMENDTVVIHEVSQRLILRLGRKVLELENRSFNEQGTFNRTGTDDGESVRLIKQGDK